MHFGNDGAHPANVLELLDKRYGISEERDYHAQIDKRWYGSDYHKNNLARTKAMVNRYTNQETKRMSPAGWLQLIKKSPGLLQNHISARKALREQILGEKFWKRMDKMKKSSEDLKNIDDFVRILEMQEPGHLVSSEGREFFNVDHYNFNAPAPKEGEDEDENEDEDEDEDDGKQMRSAQERASEEVAEKLERPDVAERKIRAVRYLVERGAEKATLKHERA
jgi:hypothetical protein